MSEEHDPEPFTELVVRLKELAETEAKQSPSFRRWLRSPISRPVAGDGRKRPDDGS